MKLAVTSRMFVFAGLLAAPVPGSLQHSNPHPQPRAGDTRLAKLKQFFGDRGCPLADQSEEFLVAADENNLDWRLLPSISFIESSGGKDYRNNNVLGWDSCKRKFTSVTAAIHAVAHWLGSSKLYRHKSLDEILTTYNPAPNYPFRVKAVMRTLGATGVRTYAAVN